VLRNIPNVEEIVKSFISCSVLSQLKHCQTWQRNFLATMWLSTSPLKATGIR